MSSLIQLTLDHPCFPTALRFPLGGSVVRDKRGPPSEKPSVGAQAPLNDDCGKRLDGCYILYRARSSQAVAGHVHVELRGR